MAEQATRLRAFVASPADTAEERVRLERVAAELNKGIAEDRGIVVDLIKWETHARPGLGSDAQDVINRQLPSPDIVIGLFWRRLGTPTPRGASGTAEELQTALEEWKANRRVEMLVYFNRAPYSPTDSDIEQLPHLRAFRSYLERSGVLVWDYDGPDDFEAQVRQHLTGVLRDWKGAPNSSAQHHIAEKHAGGDISQRWYDQLCLGSLTIDLDARRRGELQTLAAVLDAALLHREYEAVTAQRARSTLMELAVNVGRHTPKGIASIHIQLHTRFLRRVAISVHDQGSGFDLDAVLRHHLATLCRGGREHGLLHVSRVASDLVTDESTPPWRHVVRADLHDLQIAPSAFLDCPSIIRVGIYYENEDVYWLGDEPFVGDHLVKTLQFAVENECRHILDLYFERLARGTASHLGIEIVKPAKRGPPTTDALWIGEASKPEILFTAIEQYFDSYFALGNVLVWIGGGPPLPQAQLFRWLEDRRARLVETHELPSLRTILDAPGAPSTGT